MRYSANPVMQSNQKLRQTSPQQSMWQQQPQHLGQPIEGIIPQMPMESGVITGPVGPADPQPTAAPSTTCKHALQQLRQTFRSPNTPEQQYQILQILKSNPQIMAAFIKQRQVRTLQQQPQHLGQPIEGIIPQMPMESGVITGPVGPADPQPTAAPSTTCKHALQQLRQTFRSPNTPEQQYQILQILKSNPQIMAAFIKQRQPLRTRHGRASDPLRAMELRGQLSHVSRDVMRQQRQQLLNRIHFLEMRRDQQLGQIERSLECLDITQT